jgi:hypothetical protein
MTTTPTPPRYAVGAWPVSRLLLVLALVFFIIDALLLGGVISGDNLGWLLPAGLAALVLAFLVP